MRRARGSLLLVVLLLGVLSGCAASDGRYRIHASFPRTTGLFEQSRVKVMGLDVGVVETIELAGDRIAVTMLIDEEVPLPEHVTANVVALTLIGERNVVLDPPYRGPADGDPVPDGFVVPDAQTRTAAEPDDILESIVGLVESLDPERVNAVLTDAAAALDGQGETINDAAAQAGRISTILREQDERIIAAAEGLTDLSQQVTARERELARLLDSFSEAADVLVDNRQGAADLLGNLNDLTTEADAVVAFVGDTLAEDLANMALLTLTIQENTGSITQMIQLLPIVTNNLLAVHNTELQSLHLRATFTGEDG